MGPFGGSWPNSFSCNSSYDAFEKVPHHDKVKSNEQSQDSSTVRNQRTEEEFNNIYTDNKARKS